MNLTEIQISHSENFGLTMHYGSVTLFADRFNNHTRISVYYNAGVQAFYVPFGDWWEIEWNGKKRTFNDVYSANAYLQVLTKAIPEQETPDAYGQW